MGIIQSSKAQEVTQTGKDEQENEPSFIVDEDVN